ncbi:LOW QUALITY PROTEIN: rhodopsin kinase GRK7 [Glossophaga mutica]
MALTTWYRLQLRGYVEAPNRSPGTPALPLIMTGELPLHPKTLRPCFELLPASQESYARILTLNQPAGTPATVDMGGLDLIANTAYQQARKVSECHSTERQQRRRSLMLPGRQSGARLCGALPLDLDSLCEQQPIDHNLFQGFLATVSPSQEATTFLEQTQSWWLERSVPLGSMLQAPVGTGGAAPPLGHPHPFLSPTPATRCQAATTEKERAALVTQAKAEAVAFLQDQPSGDFLTNPFYGKFPQRKGFEMQLGSNKFFTEFGVLGKGGLGGVCAGQLKNTGKMYACKKLDKKILKKKNGKEVVVSQKEILERIGPFTVSPACAFGSKSHFCLVMSLANGGERPQVPRLQLGPGREQVAFYSAQTTRGLLHLHSLSIVHWDLKPENVDLGNSRLPNLGLAGQIQEGKPVTQRAKTNHYMSPEILMRKVSYSSPVDWFAMGCSIYEMVAGRTPFKNYKEKVSKEDLKQRTQEEVRFQHGNFTEEAKDIWRLFVAKKPEQHSGSSGSPGASLLSSDTETSAASVSQHHGNWWPPVAVARVESPGSFILPHLGSHITSDSQNIPGALCKGEERAGVVSQWKVTGRLNVTSRSDRGVVLTNASGMKARRPAKTALAHVRTGNQADNGEIAAQQTSIWTPLSALASQERVPSSARLCSVVFGPLEQLCRCYRAEGERSPERSSTWAGKCRVGNRGAGNSRAGRGRARAVGGASSPPKAAPGRRREAVVAAVAARVQRRGDWLRRAETSGSRGLSSSPASRGAVGSSEQASEEVSSAVPPSAADAGLCRLSRDAPPRSSPPPPPRPPLPSP